MWFAETEFWVFGDTNRDAIWTVRESSASARWGSTSRYRDGSIYQSYPTDGSGFIPFEQVFPFFKFLVVDVDYSKLRPTGATIVTDDGGFVDESGPCGEESEGKRNPQIQDVSGADEASQGTNPCARTELGPVLLEGFQAFAGQNTRIEFGKAPYNIAIGENGGIVGIVFYSTTRAEEDPRYAAGEDWESGIPRVQIDPLRGQQVRHDTVLRRRTSFR
jgi:hypothetical protein